MCLNAPLVGKGPMEGAAAGCYLPEMKLLAVILLFFLIFGGGGFYFGGPAIGGGGVGLILFICLIVYLMGGFRAKA